MKIQSFQYIVTLIPRRSDGEELARLSVSNGLNPLGDEMLRIIGKKQDSFVALEFKSNFHLTSKQSKALHFFLSTHLDKLVSINILLGGSLMVVKTKTKDGKKEYECGFLLANCSVSKWEEPDVQPMQTQSPPMKEEPPKIDPPTATKEPSARSNRRQSFHVDTLAMAELAARSPLPESTKSNDSQYTYETVHD